MPFFLDRQLAGKFGQGDHIFLGGPWPKGTPEQGYQTRFSPAQLYRAAIASIDRYVGANFNGAAFSKIAAEDQDKVLKGLESGDIKLDDGVDSKAFFAMLLQNTKEGYFSDPIYGGNKDMGAWKMIGFPGAHYDYKEWVSRHGEPRALPDRVASKAVPAGRRLKDMATTLKPVDAVLVGFGWTGAIMGQELCEAGLNVLALERGPWRDTADGFRDRVCAGRAALHVAASFVSKRRGRHLDDSQQRESRGVADAPPGRISARHRCRERRRALERSDLAVFAL